MSNSIRRSAVLFFLCSIVITSLYAVDFNSHESFDENAVKKELIYTLSKIDVLWRQYQSEGLTESLLDTILSDDNIQYLVSHEDRYQQLWNVIQSEVDRVVEIDSDIVPELGSESDEISEEEESDEQ